MHEQLLLLRGQTPSHETHGSDPERMEPEDRPIAFNENKMLFPQHAMEIKEHVTYPKLRRQYIAGLTIGDFVSRPAARIGYEASLLIVNGYANSATKHAAIAVPQTECVHELLGQSAFCEIRMARIKP